MLTPEEEQRLNEYLSLLKDVFGPDENQTQIWLAEKLREVNEKLKLQSDNSDHCIDHCVCLVCMK